MLIEAGGQLSTVRESRNVMCRFLRPSQGPTGAQKLAGERETTLTGEFLLPV